VGVDDGFAPDVTSVRMPDDANLFAEVVDAIMDISDVRDKAKDLGEARITQVLDLVVARLMKLVG
jgi:hypothetical protein